MRKQLKTGFPEENRKTRLEACRDFSLCESLFSQFTSIIRETDFDCKQQRSIHCVVRAESSKNSKVLLEQLDVRKLKWQICFGVPHALLRPTQTIPWPWVRQISPMEPLTSKGIARLGASRRFPRSLSYRSCFWSRGRTSERLNVLKTRPTCLAKIYTPEIPY